MAALPIQLPEGAAQDAPPGGGPEMQSMHPHDRGMSNRAGTRPRQTAVHPARTLAIALLALGLLTTGLFLVRKSMHTAPQDLTSSAVRAPDAQHPTPAPQAQAPAARGSAAVTITSLDGSIVFRVPGPGDPEYADYLEMLAHPRVRSVIENSPGYALPYDPEWRSMLTGRREAKEVHEELSGGCTSLEELGRSVLRCLNAQDVAGLHRLRVTEAEFAAILWPEFPQSRPYLRIPVQEAWGFHHARCLSGVDGAVQEYGGRGLEVAAIRSDSVSAYRNFVMYRDVVMEARDPRTRKTLAMAFAPVVVARNGRYKVYIYAD